MKQTLYGMAVCTAVLALCSVPGAALEKEAARDSARTKLLTIDYVNAEVTDVIRALATQSGANVALNPAVKGQITVHLRSVPVDEAMSIVSNLAGMGMRRLNETYVIAPRAEMRATLERMGSSRTVSVNILTPRSAAEMAESAFPDLTVRPQTRSVVLVGAPDDLDAAESLLRRQDAAAPDDSRITEKVDLKHRTAAQAATAVTKMVPGVSAEAAGNAVVLSGSKSQVDSARHGLEMIDVPDQSSVDMRIYMVRYTPPAQLLELLKQFAPDVQAAPGPDSYAPNRPAFNIISGQIAGITSGASGSGGAGGAGGGGGSGGGAQGGATSGGQPVVGANALSIILKGTPAAVESAMKLLTMADVAPKQMLVEARVVETSPDVTRNLGVEWEWNKFQFVERPSFSTGVVPQNPLPLVPLGFGSFGRVQFSPIATLNAMITNKQAKLLANPQISVLNDQDASIFIGDTLRIRVLATTSATAGSQFTVLEVPVGIVLLVHPRANDDGNITLRVHPVVSTLTGLVDGLPQTAAREADTTVRVKDGETLVIGGLIRDEDTRTLSKVPILGDLPLVGQLFKNDYHSHRRTEVMVFLTIRMNR